MYAPAALVAGVPPRVGMQTAFSATVPTTVKPPRRGLLHCADFVRRSMDRRHVGGGANGVVVLTKMLRADGSTVEVAAKVAKHATPAVIRELAVASMAELIAGACQLREGTDHFPIALPLCVAIRHNPETRRVGAEIIMPAGERSLAAEMATTNLAADSAAAAQLALDILKATVDLEEMRVAHKDQKPANVVVRDGRASVVDFGSMCAPGGNRTWAPAPTTDVTGLGSTPYTPPIAGPATHDGVQYYPGHGHDAWSVARTVLDMTGNGDCVCEIRPATFHRKRSAYPLAANGHLDPESHARYAAAKICQFGGIDTSRPYAEALERTANAVLSGHVDVRVRLALASIYPDAPGAGDRKAATAAHVYCTSRLLVPEDHVDTEGRPSAARSRVVPMATVHRVYSAAVAPLLETARLHAQAASV